MLFRSGIRRVGVQLVSLSCSNVLASYMVHRDYLTLRLAHSITSHLAGSIELTQPHSHTCYSGLLSRNSKLILLQPTPTLHQSLASGIYVMLLKKVACVC